MDALSIARRLREIRVAAGLSQAELALAAGVKLATLRRLELGKTVPLLTTAAELARACGVEVVALLEAPGDVPGPKVRPGGRPKKGQAT